MFDVIVLGTGGVGSAAVYQLARRGLKVLGLDRFPAGHDRGSSHGQTRVIRQAYFEHPDYVPLLLRAYELWSELEAERGRQLYHEVGLLQAGPADGLIVPGVREAARLHGLEIENFTPREAMARFPAFRLNDDWEVAFERRAGYLDVEDCVIAHLDIAKQKGADLRSGVTVHGWKVEGDGVTVDTDAGKFQAAKLAISAGAWAGPLLANLGVHFKVLRKPLHWFSPKNSAIRADQGCPTYFFETTDGLFYGFPQIDDNGAKMARHTGGTEVADPLNVDRNLDVIEQAAVQQFLTKHVPAVGLPSLNHATCMYTMSPDEHFVIDIHPAHPQVAFVAGLSGHGFKFTSVLGEVLADLATEGRTKLPIDFLNCRRKAIVA